MAIEIKCQCSRTLMVSEELAGLPTRCPNCGRRHLVPRFPARKEEPRKEEIKRAEPVRKLHCIECGTELIAGAKFCQGCGTKVRPEVADVPKAVRVNDELFPGTFGTPRPEAIPVKAKPAPEVKPAPQANPFDKPRNECRFGHGHRHGRHGVNFAKDRNEAEKQIFVEIREPKRKSGIVKAAKSLLFIGLFVAFVGFLSAIPMLDNPQVVSKESMHLAQGIFGLSLLFTLGSAFVAFLGVFHFGRARWWGIMGVIFGAFLLMGVVGNFCHDHNIFPDCHKKPHSDETEIILVDPNVTNEGKIVIKLDGAIEGFDELNKFLGDLGKKPAEQGDKPESKPETKPEPKPEKPDDLKKLPVEDF